MATGRCLHRAVLQIELCVFDIGNRCLEVAGGRLIVDERSVDVLDRRDVLVGQTLIALIDDAVVVVGCLILLELSFGILKCKEVGTTVDLVERLILLTRLPSL